MSDMERLLYVTEDEFERRLLRTAAGDRGADASLQRTLVAMGAVAAKGAATTIAGTTATSAMQGAKATGGLSSSFATGKLMTAFALGGLAGAVTTAGAEVALWSHQTNPPGAHSSGAIGPPAPMSSSVPPTVRREPDVPVVETASPRQEHLPGSSSRIAAPSRTFVPGGGRATADPMGAPSSSAFAVDPEVQRSTSNPGSVEPMAESSSLASELAALVRVQRALERHDAVSAFGLLAEYDQLFAAGGLRPEATVLRIEALFASGARTSATEAAVQFLASHPGSPHEARLRSLVAQSRVP